MSFSAILLSAAVLFATPAALRAKSDKAGDPEAGKAIFEKTCKMCHGMDGKGNPAMVKASKGAMQDLGSKEVQARTDEQLERDVAGGTPTKKAIKPLTEQQMKDVVAFVRTLAKR